MTHTHADRHTLSYSSNTPLKQSSSSGSAAATMHQRRNSLCQPLLSNGGCMDAASAPEPAPAPAAGPAPVPVPAAAAAPIPTPAPVPAAAADEFVEVAAAPMPLRCGCYFSLACSIGSMSLACGSLWQIPNTTDRLTLQRGLFLTSLGFIYFISLTDFCNKYLLETKRGQQFRNKYRLMISDVLEITNK